MRFGLTQSAGRWCGTLLLLLGLAGSAAQARELRFQALLVWAANVEKSPNPKHKPVEPEVRRKLNELPLKWKNYFEENRKSFSVSEGQSKELALSDKCSIAVKDIDGRNIEVSLIGMGKPVLKRIQPLPRKEMLVLSGPAPDSTAWLVVLKRIE